MLYLSIMFWPYLLVALAAGFAVGWFGSGREGADGRGGGSSGEAA